MDLYEQTKLKIVPITNYLEQKGLLNNEQKSNLSNLFVESDAANIYYELEEPTSSYEKSFSVYNSETSSLNKAILPVNPSKMYYIKTANNLFLESREDGSVGLVSLENIENVNSIKWKIINKDNSDFIRIVNYKDSYLRTTLSGKVNVRLLNEGEFDVEGLHNSWRIIKLDKENKYIIESNKLKGKRLDASIPLKVSEGIAETTKWILEPILSQTSNNEISNSEIEELKDSRNNIITEYDRLLKEKTHNDIFIKLLENISNKTGKYTDIVNRIKNEQFMYSINEKKQEINEKQIEELMNKTQKMINEKSTHIENNNSKVDIQFNKIRENKEKLILANKNINDIQQNSYIYDNNYHINSNKHKKNRTEKRILFFIALFIKICLSVLGLLILMNFL